MIEYESSSAQCENFSIFLSLRFYVKSILGIFWNLKTAIITILKAKNFDFCTFWKLTKFRAAEIAKTGTFWTSRSRKIDFT